MNIIAKQIYKMFPALEKINKLAHAIEEVKTSEDGSLHIKYKNHVIVETGGHCIFSSPNGFNVIQGKRTYINPKRRLVINDNIENTISQSEERMLTVESTFSKAHATLIKSKSCCSEQK